MDYEQKYEREEYMRRKTTGLWAVVIVLVILITNIGTYFITSNLAARNSRSSGDPRVEKLLYIIDQLEENCLWELDEDHIWDMVYKGALAGTDDIYSEYMTPEEYKEYSVTLDGSYSGIGIQMSSDEYGNIVVVGVFNDTPAYNAGLQVGDIIVAADGNSLFDQSATYAVTFIRGEKGTPVVLTIRRDTEEFDVSIVRDTIEIVYVTSRMLPGDIGYIYVSEFETNTYDQFSEALDALIDMGAKGLVLDLRQNPGGLVSEAVKIADELLPKCQVIYTMNKKGEKSSYDSDAYMKDLPVVLLVDGYSASSSEILTVGLRDNGRVTVVGTTTYGKGIVQVLMPMNDGSLYKYTYAEYFGPNGTKIHGVGITPDEVVELPEEYQNTQIQTIPYESDTQLIRAVEILEEEIGR